MCHNQYVNVSVHVDFQCVGNCQSIRCVPTVCDLWVSKFINNGFMVAIWVLMRPLSSFIVYFLKCTMQRGEIGFNMNLFGLSVIMPS